MICEKCGEVHLVPERVSVDDLIEEFGVRIRAAVSRLDEDQTHVQHTRLGPFLREMRQARMMSLEEVGRLAGMTKSHVWEMEKGRSVNPTVRALHGLARALGIRLSTLTTVAVREFLDAEKSHD